MKEENKESWEDEFRNKWEGANTGGSNSISTPVMNAIIEDVKLVEKEAYQRAVETMEKEKEFWLKHLLGGISKEYREKYSKFAETLFDTVITKLQALKGEEIK